MLCNYCVLTNIMGLICQGFPLDQQKLESHAESDHLVDEKSLSYNEAADICLKVAGPEKKLFNANPGMIGL